MIDKQRPSLRWAHWIAVLWVATTATLGCGDRVGPSTATDSDAASLDSAGSDGGPLDSGTVDSGTIDSGTIDSGTATADSATDASTPAPAPSGQIVLDACLGQTGIAQRCTLVTNASACTGARCSKLVVVFSGGEMGCVKGAGYSEVLAGYAERGYAAVCINYFDDEEGSGSAPYIDEAARIDLAVREATTGPWAKAYWTGEDLLLEGISHGATAPVILMARTALDEQPHWHGSHFTAGCFFDGSYDQAATAALLKTGGIGGAPCKFPVSYTRGLERYCGKGATAATCDLASHPKAKLDTLAGVPPAAWAIRDLKLFECGSAMPACSGDIIPGPPIQKLCSQIDAGPLHTCGFGSYPVDGHLTCHANQYDQCRTWFEGLLAK